MRVRPVNVIAQAIGGIAEAVRARPTLFWMVALSVFVLSLVLPVLVLSVARGPFKHATFNPWLSRLPAWLASSDVSFTRKLAFVSDLALAWVVANNAMGEVEWGFIVDVPSLARILFTSLLFGAYFALWLYRRDQVRACGWGSGLGRYGGVAGAVTNVLGLSTGPCSVMGCGVPVLPVVGLAVTGMSSGTLSLFAELSRVAIAVVLVATTLGVLWLGWLVGAFRDGQRPADTARVRRTAAGSPPTSADSGEVSIVDAQSLKEVGKGSNR